MNNENKTYLQISIDKLKIHTDNNQFFDDISGNEYEKFKESIRIDGILDPIIVSSDMTILSGHQRYKAAIDLGFKKVPILINADVKDDNDKLRILLSSNFGRNKNNPVKLCRIIIEYEKLYNIKRGNPNLIDINSNSLKQKDIANGLKISIDTYKRLKNIQKLSVKVQQLIENNKIKYTTALRCFMHFTLDEQNRIVEILEKQKLLNLKANAMEKFIKDLNLVNKTSKENIQSANALKVKRICKHINREVRKSIDELNVFDINVLNEEKKYIEVAAEQLQEYLKTLKIYDGV